MRRLLLTAVILATACTSASAADADAEPDLLKQIAALGDNTALLLPPVKTAGDGLDAWQTFRRNGPGVRDFCNRIVYAPDRKTGLYCGGNHGSPHRFNDAWEYDLATNTWTILFAPDGGNHHVNIRNPEWFKQYVTIKDGYVQTPKGGPVNPVHTWWGLAYDSDARKMLWMNVVHLQGPGAADQIAKAHGKDPAEVRAQLKPHSALWMFDPEKKQWQCQVGEPPFPKGACQGAMLEYVPTTKKTIWYANQWNESGLWEYDAATNKWTQLSANGMTFFYARQPKMFPGAEVVSAYDSKRDRILIAWKELIYELDLTKKAINLLKEEEGVRAWDSSSVFAYDSANDVAILLQQPGDLYVYDCAKNTWTRTVPAGDPYPKGRMAGYYDQARNVFVVYNGSRVWVYRYGRAKGE